jgi:hypothetical protein
VAKYRVLEKSFIDNHLREAGEEVEFDGEAGANLEAVDKPKRGKVKADEPVAEEPAVAEPEALA